MSTNSILRQRLTRRIMAAAGAFVLIGASVACAPEPVAGAGGKEALTEDSESSWGQPTDNLDLEQRVTELPASFPSDAIAIPEGAQIWNTGEQAGAENTWFLILHTAAEEDAAVVWEQFITLNGLAVTEEQETTEGGLSAILLNDAYRVTVLTMPQPDGSVLLSFDIVRSG